MHPDRTIVSSRSALAAALQRAQQRRDNPRRHNTQEGPSGAPPCQLRPPANKVGEHNASALLKLLTGSPAEQSAHDHHVAHDGIGARLFIAEEQTPARARALADISFRIASSAQRERNPLLKHILALERLAGLLQLLHPGAFLLPMDRPTAADREPMFVARNYLAQISYSPVDSGCEALLGLESITLQIPFLESAIDESAVFVLPTIEESPLRAQITHGSLPMRATRALYAAGAEGALLLSHPSSRFDTPDKGATRYVELPLRLSAHPANAAMQLIDYRRRDVALRHDLALLELRAPRLVGETDMHELRWYSAGDRLALHFGGLNDA